MPQGSTPEAVTCFKDDAVIDLNSLNQVMDPLSEGSSEMEDDAKTDDSRSDAPSLHLHPKEQQPSKSVENLISGTSGSRNITITLNPTTETKDGVMDIKSSMDDAQLSASGNYNGASDTDLEESSLRKGNSQSSCSLKISDICSLSVVQNDLAAIDQPVAGEEASVDVDCSTLNKTEGNHGAHNQSSSMDQQLIQTDVIMPPNSHNSGDGEELNEESEKFSNENKSLILTSLHTDHSDMLTRATGESPILFDSNPGQLDYVSVTGEDNASKPSDMGSVNSLKKESACLSRGSPAGHSSDKENTVSPLGECNILEKNYSDLSSPSLDGNDQKRCDIVKDTDDWGKSVTGRLSDGKKPLENKRLKLLDKVKLNRSDEGIKKVSSALRASLNKLGHQIASTPTPVMEIEVLSGSSDDENAEEVRALMKTKETTAGGNTQTCSTDNMRDSRSGKNCGVKALDSSLSVTFTAQIHSEYNNEAEKKTLSSPRRNDEVGDHEVKDGVTVEDQSNSPAGNSSHQKLPNAFTCEVEKVLPLPEQSEQKTDNNPTLIATITESTPVENCDDVVQTSAMPIPSHSNQKAAVQSSEQTNNYCHSNSALDDDEPAQVETVGNKPDTNGCRTSAYDGVDTKRPDVKDVLTSDKIDADGKSSENKNILICDDGSDSDDCVLITQVDMKRKRVLVKTEPTKPASLLSKLDLNSICSSVVSKVLEENHPSMPVNKLAQPPINITPGYRPVIPPVSLAGGKQPVTRLFPTTLRKLQPKPHSSFMPSDTSTPIKQRMAIPPGTANYRWRGATNGGNIPTVVTWTKYGPRLPSYGSQLARGLGRNGNPVLLPQEQSKANQAIVIKPSSTRGPVHNHPVASRKRHRNGVQSNDVIVLSDSD
ncbi:hypothetical protein LSH36_383g01030 [Paralvinella palmiformis]|uniref:Uncharacterized protein n=1 Tax=Paralvinella palmiformis TaxID=53620 RepID=A0AAD9JDQ4_9ANNE|nr:hypothetical protein LSH36_383g01030 [Paralvinella palmiformis]